MPITGITRYFTLHDTALCKVDKINCMCCCHMWDLTATTDTIVACVLAASCCVNTLLSMARLFHLFWGWRDGDNWLSFSFTETLVCVCVDMLNKEPPWCEGETCLACNARFGITTRRHHWCVYIDLRLA